jgi:hypothetical protein
MNAPKNETWYQWKTLFTDENGVSRLVTPRRDPMLYEDVFNYLFDTPKAARESLIDFEVDKDESAEWFLCKVTYEPIELDKS